MMAVVGFFRTVYNEIWNEPVEFPFVRRFLATAIDVAIISFADLFTGWVLFDYIGQSIFGFYYSVAYFGLSNNKIMTGRSMGKRILKIHVLDKSGSYLNLVKSAIRAAIVSFVFFGTSVLVHLLYFYPEAHGIRYALSILFIVASVGLFFFTVLDHRHRGLHDLCTGSQVRFQNDFSPARQKVNTSLVFIYLLVSLLMISYYYFKI
ncbi:MAG: RDD family protein [Cyclobacteriaceae bacterium]|jgi:uncharacterized RDD family membrane protein YckC